jgi:hypothetical protein
MRRLAVVSCVFAVCVGSMMAARLVRGDEIVDNAVIAHHRLLRLSTAIYIYLNDNNLQLDDPLRLAGFAGLTPESFWHPGDDDPMPTFIDNSIPNAPNSAQVSFLFRTAWQGNLQPDQLMIWDASPANNGGNFISVLTMDRGLETIPPVSLPFPTDVAIAQQHLARLAGALSHYMAENEEHFPETLAGLYPHGGITWARSFWNPGDSDPIPTDITNTVPDAPNSANISFDYLIGGMMKDDVTPETIVLRDNSPANNLGLGINVARLVNYPNRTVEFVLSGVAGDSNGDERVDLVDWAKFQRCHTGWGSAIITDDTCRTVDFDGNGRIDLDDYALFVEAVTGA